MSHITTSEAKTLIKSLKVTEIKEKAFIDLMLHSGLRPQEACSLRWADIEGDMVRVRNGKGGKERRSALVPTYGYLEAWRQQSGGTGYVFATRSGKPWHTSHVRRLFARLKRKTGIDVHPHGLRHAHACLVWDQTESPALVNQQLGHARLSTTDIYLRKRGKHLRPLTALSF